MERLCIRLITVDISNVWGQVSLPELLAMESDVASAHEMLMEGGPGRGWLELPGREPGAELFRLLLTAEQIRRDSEVCVVLGGSLGTRAVVELLQGQNRNLGKGKDDPLIFFAGSSLSTRQWNGLLGQLKDKDFSVIVISRSGTALESALAFRSLRWMLERKYGTDAANRRIYAVTDPQAGALRQMVQEEGWESFSLPADVDDGYSVLTAAGLLPMAVAGLDVSEILQGAGEAKEQLGLGSFENPVWLYAAVRNLMHRKGKAVELFAAFEPDFHTFGRWWQQLFGGAEGSGLFPAAGELPQELPVLERMVQEGRQNLFETMVRFAPGENPVTIGGDWKNLDGLNYLEGKTLAFVEEEVFQNTVAAHTDGGIPVLSVECGEINEQTVGELLYFLELSSGISALVQRGSDPHRL